LCHQGQKHPPGQDKQKRFVMELRITQFEEGDEVPATQLSKKLTRGVVLEFVAKMRLSKKGNMVLSC
jgi:hypothetical protein